MRARGLWRKNRGDGVVELSRVISPLGAFDRWLVIFTVVMAAAGFFVTGSMPGEIFMAVAASAVAGEVVLGAKAVLLLLLRPAAQIVEVPRFGPRGRPR